MSHEHDLGPGASEDTLRPEDLLGAGRDELPRAAGGDEIDPLDEVLGDESLRNLAGFRDADDEGEPAQRDEVDTLGSITDTEVYEGELEARVPYGDQPDEPVAENLDLLTEREFREGETQDPNVAAEEGEIWIPPIDPPVVPGEDAQPRIAAGFGATNMEEPFDADHHSDENLAEDERTERVLEALRSDAATSALADGLHVTTDGDRVFVGGEVEDIDDEDLVMEVASAVTGVGEVLSLIRVHAVDET
ncbi:MAG TPA: BON domain-containing protein [Candidatus Limnocylindrales bacterium]|nr:BON domain-containing protein [Candidatus Limnocylindrales bacterium]